MRILRSLALLAIALGLHAQTWPYTDYWYGLGAFSVVTGNPLNLGSLTDDGSGTPVRLIYNGTVPNSFSNYSITTGINSAIETNAFGSSTYVPTISHFLRDNGAGTYYQVKLYTYGQASLPSTELSTGPPLPWPGTTGDCWASPAGQRR